MGGKLARLSAAPGGRFLEATGYTEPDSIAETASRALGDSAGEAYRRAIDILAAGERRADVPITISVERAVTREGNGPTGTILRRVTDAARDVWP